MKLKIYEIKDKLKIARDMDTKFNNYAIRCAREGFLIKMNTLLWLREYFFGKLFK